LSELAPETDSGYEGKMKVRGTDRIATNLVHQASGPYAGFICHLSFVICHAAQQPGAARHA
jgi:hypothetical protein